MGVSNALKSLLVLHDIFYLTMIMHWEFISLLLLFFSKSSCQLFIVINLISHFLTSELTNFSLL